LMSVLEPRIWNRLWARLAVSAVIAMAFLIVCWLAANSVYGDTRLLAGPLGFFRTQSIEDKVFGAIPTAILLPCIFAVGVWRNAGTIVLSILGLLSWVAVGIWIEGLASC
jgi:hypothetical protein